MQWWQIYFLEYKQLYHYLLNIHTDNKILVGSSLNSRQVLRTNMGNLVIIDTASYQSQELEGGQVCCYQFLPTT